MSRLAAVVATLLAVVLLGAAVWAQAPRDVVVVGMEAEPPGLDPGQALGLHTLRVTAEIFETRSEEHTSELQSRGHLVCRLLLEKKKKIMLDFMTIRSR